MLVAAAAVLAQAPAKPQLAPTFTANVSIEIDALGNGIVKFLNGTIYYDEAGKQAQLRLVSSYFGQDFDYSSFELPTSGFETNNGVCRPTPGKAFSSYFGWIQSPAAKFNSTQALPNGGSCNVWTLQTPTVLLSACCDSTFCYNFFVTGNGRPVQIYFSGNAAARSAPIQPPPACFAAPPVCPKQQNPWITMSMFRLHNINDTTLANRNTGSLIGDLFYICAALVANPNSPIVANNTVVSNFNVFLNSTWGQYGLCNHDECVGSDNVTVGHEATSGFTVKGGQCVMHHNTIGDWFSLTAVAQCAQNATTPSTACAWQLKSRVKSVAMPCLVQNGLITACKADSVQNGFPFPNAQRVVLKAFARTCPDTPPPTPFH